MDNTFSLFIIYLKFYRNSKRGLEIKEWLKEHPDTEDFVILDDEIFSTYDEYLIEKLIKISSGNGGNFGGRIIKEGY